MVVLVDGGASADLDRFGGTAVVIRPLRMTSYAIEGGLEDLCAANLEGRADVTVGELVAIIGKTAKNVSKENALDYVMGYTIGNDVSARDWQNGPEKDMQWWRAKGSDTFGPLGPIISTDIDPFDFTIQVLVNGEKTANKAHSKDLIFDIPTVIAEISKYVTLDPGDIIYTGTPGQTSQLQPGDVVEVEIPGIGVLRNPVVSE